MKKEKRRKYIKMNKKERFLSDKVKDKKYLKNQNVYAILKM
jgi:hypothetical protein